MVGEWHFGLLAMIGLILLMLVCVLVIQRGRAR
jgi:hypothetical protein